MSAAALYEALARSTLAHELESAFVDATGLSVELMPSGEPMRLLRFRRRENPFCRLMAGFTGSCAACQQVHTELQRRIAENFTPQAICCFAGLVEFAVPIVVGGEHVATLIGGQVFQRKPSQAQLARLKRQLRAWGIHPLRQVEANLFQTRVISRKKIQASVQMLRIFASLLAEDINRDLLAAHVRDRPCITSAKSFIDAHARESLHLRDVAEYLHVSTHYFCKFFKKETGIGFSEFLGRLRVKNAKDLLADPVLLINEVASQSGFGSLSQFNRAFHRFVGCSPKQYRASLSQEHSC